MPGASLWVGLGAKDLSGSVLVSETTLLGGWCKLKPNGRTNLKWLSSKAIFEGEKFAGQVSTLARLRLCFTFYLVFGHSIAPSTSNKFELFAGV